MSGRGRIIAVFLVDDAVFGGDGLDRHHHDLRLGVLDERASGAPSLPLSYSKQAGREAVVVRKLVLEILEGIEHAFLDGDGWNENDELRQPVFLIKPVDGAEINQRLARASFHLNADVVVG